ncbi:hypothetical protein LTR33_004692 [Friedmanniomyces endolithicus]|nr:hypothetical protein LTR33_004692 [Friedmanniomyces endolithicus]
MVSKRAARRLLCLALLLGLTTALAIAALQPQTAMEDVNAPPRYMRVPHRLHDGPTLRLATKDDLDGIMRIVRAGFPDDPEVDYRFPARGTYPEDYLKWTRLEYEHYIEQPDKFVVHLAEIPDHSGSEVVMEPVALAVWDTAVLTKANGTDEGLDERRDANKEHCKAFTESAGKAFAKYFAKYAEKQIHLWLIVTHPNFRRRGAGSVLMKWGIDAAEQKGWPVTVFASPMGELLYSHLGFSRIATKIVQVDDEPQKLTSAIMEKQSKQGLLEGLL